MEHQPAIDGKPTIDRVPALVVGLGASAGGLRAFKTFFTGMAPGSGMAFVLVQHLAPNHPSVLVELIAQCTPMQVVEAADGMIVQPDHVYVIRPDTTLTIAAGRLCIRSPRQDTRPIDAFLLSLAEDQGEHAVAVVLSGLGSDGTRGAEAVKEGGGLTIAQADAGDTPLQGMPRSAADTGRIDRVLPVEAIPAALIDYQHRLSEADPQTMQGAAASGYLDQVCRLIDESVGHDFGEYKKTTLARRVQRRMQFHRIDSPDAYLAKLRAEPAEVDLLFQDLLIGVTRFFRDTAAFGALQTLAVPRLMQKGEVRVWVPGCASGEEAYTLAMLLLEASTERADPPKIRVFGTDISESAISIARQGRYREPQVHGLSPERLARWFTEDRGEYTVRPELRETCSFSIHSVVRDPPFSHVDLVSCRNVLIYMSPALQGQLISVFHHSLNRGGYLFLGPAESVSRKAEYFAALDETNRVFRRRDNKRSALPRFPLERTPGTPRAARPTSPVARPFADEEFQTVNEELQAANEELQTSQEELQSINEELQTVNSELISANATLAELNSDLTNFLESTAIATLFLDTKLRIRRFTPAATGLFELRDTDAGRAITDIGSRLDYRSVAADCRQALRDLTVVEREVTDRHDTRAYVMRIRPYRTVAGAVDGVVITFVDVTDRRQREAAQARLAAIVDSTQDAVFSQNLDGCITTWNLGAEHLTGYVAAEAVGSTARLIFPPQQATQAERVFKRIRNGHRVENYQTLCQRKDAGLVNVALTASPIMNAEGKVIGLSVIARDVSERVAAQRHRDMLMAELDHRVKNTLVAVQSIARQTAQGAPSVEAFQQAFEARLIALSRTHNLLMDRHWTGASLREMVVNELLPYEDVEPRYTVAGPDVQLTPKQALALGLGFHELATNAAKHGAFSAPGGHVAVSWDVADAGTGPVLTLRWVKSGGPRVAEPKTRGFGSRLIERGLRSELQADVRLAFLPDGVTFELRAPLGDESA